MNWILLGSLIFATISFLIWKLRQRRRQREILKYIRRGDVIRYENGSIKPDDDYDDSIGAC